MNKRVESGFRIIEQEFLAFPKNAKYVSESLFVWYGIYRKLAEELGLDAVLSNPYLMRITTKFKKKTSRFDVRALTDCSRQRACARNLKMPHNRFESNRFYSSKVRPKSYEINFHRSLR